MDRKEAIDILNNERIVIWTEPDEEEEEARKQNEAIDMAIESLSTEVENPCKTCGYYNFECPKDCEYGKPLVESNGDLISRTAAIKAVAKAIWHYPNECYRNLNAYDMAEALAKDAIMPLPSVNIPTKYIAQININTDKIVKRIKDEYEINDRPSAEWIMHIDDLYPEESTQECSNCHEHETIKIHNDDYCPNCGARMNKGIK